MMKHVQKIFLVAVLFLLPWQAVWLVRPDASQFTRLGFYATDILMMIAVVWVRPRIALTPVVRALGIVLGYLFFISLFTSDPLLALWKLATVIAIGLFVLSVIRTLDVYSIRWALLAAGGVEAMIALSQFLLQQISASTILGISAQDASMNGASVIMTNGERWLRAYGSFPHPNILGGFLAVVLMLAVDEYFHCYERCKQWWQNGGRGEMKQTAITLSVLLTVIVVMLFALFASFSRSALLAFTVAFVCYCVMKIHQRAFLAPRLSLKLLFVFLAAAVAWALLFPGLLTTRLEAEGTLETHSISDRIAGYRVAWNVIRQEPLLGTGLGQYVPHAAVFSRDTNLAYVQPVHNVFVLAFAEVGLFVSLMIVAILWWWFQARKSLWWQPLVVTMAGVLIIISLLDHYFWSLHAGMILVAMAIIAAANTESSS